MRDATLESFRGQVGTAFQIDELGVELTLTQVDERGPSSFSLLFDGPVDPIVPQSTYTFRDGNETMPIFVVPLGPGARGTPVYEAVFAGLPSG